LVIVVVACVGVTLIIPDARRTTASPTPAGGKGEGVVVVLVVIQVIVHP